MENITLQEINRNLILLRREVQRVASIIEESSLELDDKLAEEIELSRKRDKREFVSHEEMRREFCRV